MQDKTNPYPVLSEILRKVFARNDLAVTPELSAGDVAGWDSFKQIEIILSVERAFGIKLNSREVDGLHCVGDLAAVISRKA